MLRFDPAETPISLALRSETRTLREMTALADETIRKDLRGRGRWPGDNRGRREARDRRESRRGAARVPRRDRRASDGDRRRREPGGLPAGRLESRAGEKLVRIAGRLAGPADFAASSWRCGRRSIRLGDVAMTTDDAGGARRRSSTASRGRHRRPQGLEGEHGRGRGSPRGDRRAAPRAAPRGRHAHRRPRQLSVDPRLGRGRADDDRDRALLTVLVVFAFLNSWRSTVITGLTLPVSVIASFARCTPVATRSTR